MRYLASELGYNDVDEICASNLIFTRSRGELGSGGWLRADVCWPVHELVLDVVRPRCIITHGKLPLDYVTARADMRLTEITEVKSHHSKVMEWLRSLAEKERRSLNQQAILLLERALEEQRPSFTEAYEAFLSKYGPSPFDDESFEDEVLRLRDELQALRDAFDAFRAQFE